MQSLQALTRGYVSPQLGNIRHSVAMARLGQVRARLGQVEGEEPIPLPYSEEEEALLREQGGGTPGAVPVRPENWDDTTSPPTYQVALGDTLVGLAITYLGDGKRYTEIYGMNRDVMPGGPSDLRDVVLKMPREALDNLYLWLDAGEPSKLPGTLGREARSPLAKKGLSQGAKLALAGVAVVGLGAVVYYASK